MKSGNKALFGILATLAIASTVHAANVAIGDGSSRFLITTSQTWTANNVYILDKLIFVTAPAKLTIEPGTIIRGEPFTTGGTSVLNPADPGALIIARGAKIRALGTRENPIVFTCEGDDNIGANPGTGVWAQKNNGIGKKWGGVILLGRTYIATNVGEPGTPSPDPSLQLQIEGIESYGDISKYGGGDDDDNSGEMHYCSIRYGGYILGAANEINGLTLGAVGRGTQIDHIEVYHNADDDYEMFGGTVNLKYLVAWSSTDDGFDTDEGYRGKGQFFLRAQGPLAQVGEKSDKGTEEDGGMGDLSQPSSIPTWYNWTEVGMGKESGQKKNTAIMMRDGTGGRFYNCLFMDFGGACALIEGDLPGGSPDGDGDAADKFGTPYVNNAYYTHEAIGLDGVQSMKGEMKYNVWWKMGTNVAFGCAANTNLLAGVWGADGTDGNKAHYGYPLFTDATLKNFYLDEAAFLSPVSTLTRSLVGYTHSDGKTYYAVDTLNPLPRAGYDTALMTFGRVPPNDGFYTPVAFIGAFGNGKNWAAGWTLASRLGELTGGTAADYTGLVPGLRINAGNVEASLAADNYAGIPADFYLLVDGGVYGWFRFDVASSSWVPFNLAAPVPSLGNAPIGDIGWTPVLAVSALPAGQTYPVYFGIDVIPGNGAIDLDRLFFAVVSVVK